MSTHTNLSRTGIGALAAGLLVAGLLGVSAYASAGPNESKAPSSVFREAPPEGKTGVAGPDGSTVGYIDDAAWDQAMNKGEPLLDLGSGRFEIRGLEVSDQSGRLVGYFLSGEVGFVPLDVARDDRAMDELAAAEAKSQAETADSEVIREANERMKSEAQEG